jgi:hypothetical protein
MKQTFSDGGSLSPDESVMSMATAGRETIE